MEQADRPFQMFRLLFHGKVGQRITSNPCVLAHVRQVVRLYTTKPLGGIGARVTGVDITQPISPEVGRRLRDDVTKHELLVFQKQRGLSVERLLEFTKIFGPLDLEPQQGKAMHPKQPHPAITRVSTDVKEGLQGIGNTALHIDGQYMLKPNDYSIFHTLKASKGSQTWFVSMSDILDNMDQERLNFWDTLWQKRILNMHSSTKESEIIQPLVVQHPRTRRKVLCAHLRHVDRFIQYHDTLKEKLLSKEDSKMILEDIEEEMRGKEDERVFKYTWSDDDVIVLDNWALLHMAGPETQLPLQEVGTRIFHRVMTQGSHIPQKKYTNLL